MTEQIFLEHIGANSALTSQSGKGIFNQGCWVQVYRLWPTYGCICPRGAVRAILDLSNHVPWVGVLKIIGQPREATIFSFVFSVEGIFSNLFA